MSFQVIIAKNDKGRIRLKMLYIKLYFSSEPDIDFAKVEEDKLDPVLIECVKSLLKNKESFRGSLEIMEVPAQYIERFSIEEKDGVDCIIIKDKKDDEPEIKEVFIPRSQTIAMSIFNATRRSPFSMINNSRFKPGRTAFSGYWDSNARAEPCLPPIYIDDDP